MRILITGGAGFIGSHLTDLLLDRGHDVSVYDNLRTGRLENLAQARASSRFTFHQADVLDGAKLGEICRSYSPAVLVHLAALVSVQDARNTPDENFRLNVEATHRVACAAAEAHIPRVVFASSAAIYGDNTRIPLGETELPSPVGPYGGAKAASELLLASAGRDRGFESISLRFFNVFGPRQRPDSPYSGVISIFADRASRQLPVTVFGDGHQTRDFVPVKQLAAAIAAVAEAPKGLDGTFNVCTGKQTSLRQLLACLEAVTGHKLSVTYADPRPGDIVHSLGNPVALEAAVGFHPTIDLSRSLGELLASVRSSTS